MNVWARFEADLRKCITEAWPEVWGPTHPIFRVTQAERRPWRSLYQGGDLEAPWVVWMADQTAQVPGWGACNVVFQPKITVYYVTDGAGEPDIASYVQQKLDDLDAVLRAQAYDGFQFWHESFFDISAKNAANSQFLKNNIAGLFGGALSFRVMFGYVQGETSP